MRMAFGLRLHVSVMALVFQIFLALEVEQDSAVAAVVAAVAAAVVVADSMNATPTATRRKRLGWAVVPSAMATLPAMTVSFARVAYVRNRKRIYHATAKVVTPVGSVRNAPKKMVAASLLQKIAKNAAKHALTAALTA